MCGLIPCAYSIVHKYVCFLIITEILSDFLLKCVSLQLIDVYNIISFLFVVLIKRIIEYLYKMYCKLSYCLCFK